MKDAMNDISVDKIPTRAEVRAQIEEELLTDSELDEFCLDYFFHTFRRFSRGMERTEKVNLLLQTNEPKDIFEKLQEKKSVLSQQASRRPSWRRHLKKIYLLILGGILCDYLNRAGRFLWQSFSEYSKTSAGIFVVIITTTGVFIVAKTVAPQRGHDNSKKHSNETAIRKERPLPEDLGTISHPEVSVKIEDSLIKPESDSDEHQKKWKHETVPIKRNFTGQLLRVELSKSVVSCSGQDFASVIVNDVAYSYECGLADGRCRIVRGLDFSSERERAITFVSMHDHVMRFTRKLQNPKQIVRNGRLISELYYVDIENCKFTVGLFRQ